jgi:hypothetical protein
VVVVEKSWKYPLRQVEFRHEGAGLVKALVKECQAERAMVSKTWGLACSEIQSRLVPVWS